MISLDRTDQLLAEADPLHDAVLRDRAPRRRRRPAAAVAGLAVAGLAAAAVVALVLTTGGGAAPTRHQASSRIDIRLPGRHARAVLTLVADRLDASAVRPTTVTTRERLLDYRDTADGRAYFWQTIPSRTTVSEHSTDYVYDFGPPQFLIPADRARALHLTDPHSISVGIEHSTFGAGSDGTRTDPAVLAALPTNDPRALLAALQHDVDDGPLGGCVNGPACAAANLDSLLRSPDTSTRLRAACIRALGYAPGVTVLDHRVVDGRRGLAIESANGFTNDVGPETVVLDESSGQVLSDVTRLGPAGTGTYAHRVPDGTAVDSIVVVH